MIFGTGGRAFDWTHPSCWSIGSGTGSWRFSCRSLPPKTEPVWKENVAESMLSSLGEGKMTSTGAFSPWDPPKPLSQKPPRVTKAGPPAKSRPHLAPKPCLAGHSNTHPLDTVKIRESVNEAKNTGNGTLPHEENSTPEAKNNTLGIIKKSGNVKKIVNQFDHVLGPKHKEIPHPDPQHRKLLRNTEPAKDTPPLSLPAQEVLTKSCRPIENGDTETRLPLPKSFAKDTVIPTGQNCATEKKDETIPFSETLEDNLEDEGGSQPGPETEDPDLQCSQNPDVQVSVKELPTECPNNCPCICHIQRPGMVLSWVPALREEAEGEEDDEAFSDSSSLSESQPFQHVFVVNEDPEEHQGLSAGITSKGKTEKASEMGFRDADMCKGHSPDRLKDTTSGDASSLNSETTGSVTSDDSTTASTEEKMVTVLSYRSAAKETSTGVLDPVGFHEDKLSDVKDSEGKRIAASCDTVSQGTRISKPPRRSKAFTKPSPENKEQPPAIPPRVPIKPPRALSASSPFLKGAAFQKKREDEEELQTQDPSLRHSLPPAGVVQVPSLNNGRSSPLIAEESRLQQEKTQAQMSTVSGEGDHADQDVSPHSQEPMAIRPKLTTQRSIDWESRLQDEPLYQTYRQIVISKEIKRQTVGRNISKTSIDYNYETVDLHPERGRASPKTGQRSSSHQNTLWQDLPVVQDSGILEQITKEERRLQESMFEVLTSEASYLRSLNVLINHFMTSKELDNAIIIREKKILFSNITKVKEVSESFLKDLEDRVDESVLITDICDIIHYHAKHHFAVYIDYVRNQIYQEQTYSSIIERNIAFAVVITRLQEMPQCQKLPFMSFLLLPFQRITRIKMLTENILKRTEEGSTREQNASKALASISTIIENCNREVGKMKQTEELIHIAKKIQFDKLKAIPIISQNRHVEKQGELSEVIQRGSIFGLKPKFTPVYLFLFSDLLLISRKSSDRYVVLDYAHRSLVQAQQYSECPQSTGMENCFYLSLLENHQGKTSERLFKAPTQSDMHRWIDAFPKPNNQLNSSTETVYEDWDCPQVQCVETYIAQQTDELNLEPTDIINVLRKTSEGWYEGIRLSDGQKGWFPGNHTEEITNDHVRMRNLRERYRVLQAARSLQKKKKAVDTKKKCVTGP